MRFLLEDELSPIYVVAIYRKIIPISVMMYVITKGSVEGVVSLCLGQGWRKLLRACAQILYKFLINIFTHESEF